MNQTNSMDRAAIYRFLTQHRYGVFSSLSATGTPQSALVGIAITSELEIIFDTLKTTRKYSNLIARPTCSLVIGWENEQTVQFEGTAFEPQGSEVAKYQEAYFVAWPEGPARITWSGITWIVVRPRWLRYTDFNQSPPLIVEIPFPDR
jgi:pyridoxine/pyridoxamine 5'-phosphate oxidase